MRPGSPKAWRSRALWRRRTWRSITALLTPSPLDWQCFRAAADDGFACQIRRAESGGDRDYEAAFPKLAERGPDALVIAPSAVFASDTDDVVALTLRHEIPAMFERRADVVAAGLISYGASRLDAWRLAGIYVGEILKGAMPADMPVLQSVKLELVINETIAKSLGLTIPPSLLGQADEVGH